MTNREAGRLLGISGNRYSSTVQSLLERTGWTRPACKQFVLAHYNEAVTLCLLRGVPVTKRSILTELIALAKDETADTENI